MSGRAWLIVVADRAPAIGPRDTSIEVEPIPDELAVRDRMALVSWPGDGTDRRPMLAGTATVTRISAGTHTVRLRHRVSPVGAHRISVASLGPRLAFARGWHLARRAELLDSPRLIDERDFTYLEAALLETARTFGPPAKRPAHAKPQAPGRRALMVGRLAWGR